MMEEEVMVVKGDGRNGVGEHTGGEEGMEEDGERGSSVRGRTRDEVMERGPVVR